MGLDPALKRILVIDHHPIVLEGIVAVFAAEFDGFDDIEIIGSSGFNEALAFIRDNPVNLIVTDFRVQADTALSFLQDLKRTSPGTRCLILSNHDEIHAGYPCIKAGASGFVGKSLPPSSRTPCA